MSTQKECLVCKRKIGVASKTCALCGAKQPYKQRLEDTKRKLSHGWKERQKKYSSVSKVYDATDLLIHKWELLERHPMLLLARRTSNGFSAECFCPWQISCEGREEAISTIQRIYESLLNVALTSGAVGKSGQRKRPPPDTVEPPAPPAPPAAAAPPPPPAAPPAAAALPPAAPLPPPPPLPAPAAPPAAAAITADPGSGSMAPPLIRPQLSSDFASIISPASSSSTSSSDIPPLPSSSSSSSSSPLTRPVSSSSSRLTPPVPSPLVSPPSPTTLSSPAPSPAPSDSSDSPTRRRDPTECPVHQRSTSFPYRTILGERITEGQAEVLVQWYPCSGCGERWKNTWEPKENLLTSSP